MDRTMFQIICVGIMMVNALLSACSQILLKKSSLDKHSSLWKEYINWRVMTAYLIYAYVLLSNAYAYQGVAYKYGSMIGAASYFFLMLLSKLILKETISHKTIIGNAIIIAGMIVYSCKSC